MGDSQVVDEQMLQQQADVCKVFSSPHRLALLCLLKNGERSFTELQEATGLSKPNLSQHLGLLRSRGIVNARRDGAHVYVSVANPKTLQACQLMREVLCEQLAAGDEWREHDEF